MNVNGVVYDYPETDDTDWGPEATDWAAAITTGMLQKAGGLFQLLSELDFGTSFGIKALTYSTRSANLATSGEFRLAQTDVINWRNAANTLNLALSVDSSGVLNFDGTGISSGGTPVQQQISVLDTSTIDMTLASSKIISADIITQSITNSLISNSAAIAFSKLATLTAGNILLGNISNVPTSTAVTGDVTISSSGVTAIGTNKVVNSMLAQMATVTIKGNNTGGTANALDLTGSQVTAMLSNFVGDSGAGGTKGLVLAPAAGDAAASKFLAADGTWKAPSGSGDVVGPGSSTNNGFAKFSGTTGKLLQDSPATIVNADVSGSAAIAYSKLNLATSIVNADISASAAIAYSKLNLATSIVNADISASAAIAYSKLSLSLSILNADISASAAIAFSKLATLNSTNILVGSAGNVATAVAVTGDVTIGNTGVTAIGTNKVTNAMLAQAAANTIKGNNTGSTANELDLTATQVRAMLATPPVYTTYLTLPSQTGWMFTCTSFSATAGATYTNNGQTYTVLGTYSALTLLFCSNASAPTASGTLTKASGTGDATIAFSTRQATATYTPTAGCAYVEVELVGGGGGAGGSGTAGQAGGPLAGTGSFFYNPAITNGVSLAFGGNAAASNIVGGTGGGAGNSAGTAIRTMSGGGGGGGGTQLSTFVLPAGVGGASVYGGGGFGAAAGNAGGAGLYGGGGGGAGMSNAIAGTVGAGGGSGAYAKFAIQSPSGTYPFAVGPGGSGGTAGTSGFAGGVGGSGLVTFTEYFI